MVVSVLPKAHYHSRYLIIEYKTSISARNLPVTFCDFLSSWPTLKFENKTFQLRDLLFLA